MYNEEQKIRYIDDIKESIITSPNFVGNIFTNSMDFENQLNKDICNWTTQEILSWYSWLSKTSLESLLTINSTLRGYVQWCMLNNLVNDHQNHFNEININNLKKCINLNLLDQMIISREFLISNLNRLVNPLDKYVVLATFEGIRGKEMCELVSLKTTDICDDYVNLCSGRKVKISNELKDIIYESANTYNYFPNNGESEVVKILEGGVEDVYKKSCNAKSDDISAVKRTVYNKLKKIIVYLDLSEMITINSLYASGQIDYIKQLAKKYNLSVKELILNHKNVVEKELKSQYPEFNLYRFEQKYVKSNLLD